MRIGQKFRKNVLQRILKKNDIFPLRWLTRTPGHIFFYSKL
jgi:hypothetical protein